VSEADRDQSVQSTELVVTVGAPSHGGAEGQRPPPRGAAHARNSAATLLQQRMTSTPDWQLGEGQLRDLTLAEVDSHVYEHPDWANHPALGEKSALWDFLKYAKETPGFVAALGMFKVDHLLTTGGAAGREPELARYAGAVSRTIFGAAVYAEYQLPAVRELGKALMTLDGLMPRAHQALVFGLEANGLSNLFHAGMHEAFFEYLRVVAPLLTSENGADARAFMEFFLETGGRVTQYANRLRYVRNHHHFEIAALEQLAANEADVSRRRPLTAVLYSAVDHNGAFMRTPSITQLVLDRRNQVIVVEGNRSLAEAAARTEQVAGQYGQGGHIDQVLVVGHGDARGVQMAAHRTEAGEVEKEDIDLNVNPEKTDALFASIMKLLDPRAPHKRLAFFACLTNSNALPDSTTISSDPIEGASQLRAGLQENESLVSHVRRMATVGHVDLNVVGANASVNMIGPGVQSEEPRTGAVTISDSYDPQLVSQKIDYLRTGTEPVGVMRALVESWSVHAVSCRQVVEARLADQKGAKFGDTFEASLLDVLLRLALDAGNDPARLVALSRLADAMESLCYQPGVWLVKRLSTLMPAADLQPIFERLDSDPTWQKNHASQLVAWQALAAQAPSCTARVLRLVDPVLVISDLIPFIDVTSVGARAALTCKAAPDLVEAQGLLAAVFLVHSRKDPDAIRVLRGLTKDQVFPDRIVQGIQGALTETDLRSALEWAADAPPLVNNVDLSGSGLMDTNVIPTLQEMIVMRPTRIFRRPGGTGATLGSLRAGDRVRVTGWAGASAMIAVPNLDLPGFVPADALLSDDGVASAQ
jgi:hypothetical protein